MKTVEEIRKAVFIIYENWDNGLLTTLEYEEKIYTILTEWGKELCEEQKRIVKSQGLILDAPLPTILKDER